MHRRGDYMNKNSRNENNNIRPQWSGASSKMLREQNDKQTEELARTVDLMKKVDFLIHFVQIDFLNFFRFLIV